ncbi:MAG: hypothetical protein QOE61_468 [Micromonosporaceae bacterium]|jgi:crotonobetainyl-CoA hydratase|nr:hypothetical protein [Micromonosporaceae bacterium]
MSDGIRFELDGHVARVTIDRPHVLNALDDTAQQRLEQIWQEIEASRDVRVVVLTGSGDRAFCVGADMSAVGNNKTGVDYWAEGRPNGFGGLALRETLDVPVIARLNGYTLGGGLEMALGCDILVASETAQLGLTEPRVGRVPLDGGVTRLVRQAPYHQAMGLLNEVVPAGDLDAAIDRWVGDVLACAPLSLRAIKHMVQNGARLSPREAQSLRSPALVAALRSKDSDEGVRAFQEKRAPIWRGE